MSGVINIAYTHYDTQGSKWQIYIYGNSAATLTKELAPPYFELTWEGNRLKRARLDVYALIEDASDIASYPSAIFSATLLKDDVAVWTGVPYVLGGDTSEGTYPYVKILSFRDPLRYDDYPLQNVETYTRLVDIFVQANSGLLPINTYPAWYNVDESPLEDIFHYTYIDAWAFRRIENDADDAYRPLTFLQVLEQVLQSFDAVMYQYQYRWHIVQQDFWASRPDLLDADTMFGYYEYDNTGAQLNAGTGQGFGVSAFTATGIKFLPASSGYFEESYGQVAYRYEHRNKESTLVRFPEQLTLFPGQSRSEGGPHVASNPGGDRFYFTARISSEPLTYYEDDDVTAEVQVTVTKTLTSTGYTKYWNGAAWSPVPATVSLPNIPGVRQADFAYARHVFEGTVEFKTGAVDFGDVLTVTVRPLLVAGASEQLTSFRDIEFAVVADEDDPDASGEENTQELTYSLTGISATGGTLELDNSIIGVGPNEISRGSLRTLNAGTYNRTPDAYKHVVNPTASSTKFAEKVLRSHLDRLYSNRSILRASLLGPYDVDRIYAYEGKRYVFERGKVSGVDGKWEVYLSEVRAGLVTSYAATFNANKIGYIPGTTAPTQYRTSKGLRASRIEEETATFKAAIGVDGAGAPATLPNGELVPDKSVAYNTSSGDTLPYIFDRLQPFNSINVFTSSTDDWAAVSPDTTLLHSSQSRFGALDSGVLVATKNTTPVAASTFEISKLVAAQEYTGYVTCEVYIPSTNGATQGVQLVCGSQVDSTTTQDEWVQLGVLNSGPSAAVIRGVDSGGNSSYVQTAEDSIRVRAVSFVGNVFTYLDGQLTNYGAETDDWQADIDIPVVRNVATGELLTLGFVTFVDNDGYAVLVSVNDSALNSGTYQYVGRWQKTVVSISGDVITTGTINAALVNIIGLDTVGTEVLRAAGPNGPTARNDGSGLQVGDVWIETDNGDKIYTWNGTLWVPTLTVISGDNIVTGAINASLITTGTLDASAITITGLDTAGSQVIRATAKPATRDDGSNLQEGDVWVDTDDGNRPYTWDPAAASGNGDFVEALTVISGGNIVAASIDANKLNINKLSAVTAQTGDLTVDGELTVSAGGKVTGTGYELNDGGGNIAGWIIGSDTLSSGAAGAARIELDKANSRVEIVDSNNVPIVAMGFLNGLAKNAGGGNWGASDYGFWAKDGDKLQIDGNVDYVDGDFIVQSNGVLKSQNYNAGTAGFQITGNGDAEFNDVTVRGVIAAGAGSAIDGSYISTGTVAADRIDVSGVITAGSIATTTDVSTAVTGLAYVLRAAGPTGPTTRTGGGALQAGDFWIDTANGDKPYTWDGSAWVAAYTEISGGAITTGTVDAARIDVSGVITAGSIATTTDVSTAVAGVVVVIRADGPNGPTTRSGGGALVPGDIWIETNQGDRPYTWNGSAWKQAYTKIDGGAIQTGAIKSSNYAEGITGWAINTNGAAEFSSAVFRGSVSTSEVLRYDADFGVDLDFSESGVLSIPQASYQGETDVLKVTLQGGNVQHYLESGFPGLSSAFRPNRKYRVFLRYYIDAGQTSVDRIVVATDNASDAVTELTTTGAWTNVNVVYEAASGTELRIYAGSAAGTTIDADGEYFWLKDVAVYELPLIDGDGIKTNSVTAAKINVANLAALSGTMGTLTIDATLTGADTQKTLQLAPGLIAIADGVHSSETVASVEDVNKLRLTDEISFDHLPQGAANLGYKISYQAVTTGTTPGVLKFRRNIGGTLTDALTLGESASVAGVITRTVRIKDQALLDSRLEVKGKTKIDDNAEITGALTLGTDLALAHGGTGASLTAPAADRMLFYDNSAASVAFLEAGSGLEISNTQLQIASSVSEFYQSTYSGVPPAATGKVGDLAFDDGNNKLYIKTQGAGGALWVLVSTL